MYDSKLYWTLFYDSAVTGRISISAFASLLANPTDLSKLTDVVKNEIVNKDVYNELVKKVIAINTSWLINKANYDVKISKINSEMSNITELATTAVLNAVKNELHNLRGLVKKADYNPKKTDIEGKYFTTSDYSKFVNEILDAKIKNKKTS